MRGLEILDERSEMVQDMDDLVPLYPITREPLELLEEDCYPIYPVSLQLGSHMHDDENQHFVDKFINLEDSPKGLVHDFPSHQHHPIQIAANNIHVDHQHNSTALIGPKIEPGLNPQQQETLPSSSLPQSLSSHSNSSSSNNSFPAGSSGPNFAAHPTIRLVEGFSNIVLEEQPGGSANKAALPLQVVELVPALQQPNKLVLVEVNPSSLFTVQVFVVGYDNHGQKKVLTEQPVGESSFIEVSPGVFRAMFPNIVCTHTSHHYGKSLCLRFVLVKVENRQPLQAIDSCDFKTLTQRAWQKRKEKTRHASIALVSQHGDKGKGKVTSCTPQIGPCQGGQLVKISGLGFNTTTSRVVVKFGEKSCRHVYSVAKNTIICETPEHNAGTVEIKVALDGKVDFAEGRVHYTYIRPSDINGVFKYVQHVLGTDHRFLHKM